MRGWEQRLARDKEKAPTQHDFLLASRVRFAGRKTEDRKKMVHDNLFATAKQFKKTKNQPECKTSELPCRWNRASNSCNLACSCKLRDTISLAKVLAISIKCL